MGNRWHSGTTLKAVAAEKTMKRSHAGHGACHLHVHVWYSFRWGVKVFPGWDTQKARTLAGRDWGSDRWYHYPYTNARHSHMCLKFQCLGLGQWTFRVLLGLMASQRGAEQWWSRTQRGCLTSSCVCMDILTNTWTHFSICVLER